MHWKGIFRTAKDGEFKSFPKTPVRIEIRDPRWNLVYQKDHTTDELGTVAGEFTLGDEPSLGMYYLQSSIGGQGSGRRRRVGGIAGCMVPSECLRAVSHSTSPPRSAAAAVGWSTRLG